MKNETKLKKVQKFLEENGIQYRLPKERRFGHSDLWIPNLKIFVKIDGEDRHVFYEKHHVGRIFPVFIRDEDTPKFVIEKVQDTIIRAMTLKQKDLLKRKKHDRRRIKEG